MEAAGAVDEQSIVHKLLGKRFAFSTATTGHHFVLERYKGPLAPLGGGAALDAACAPGGWKLLPPANRAVRFAKVSVNPGTPLVFAPRLSRSP